MLFERTVQYLRRMYKTFLRCTLIWSFVLGAFLGVLFFKTQHSEKKQYSVPDDLYEKWFNKRDLIRTHPSPDLMQYGKFDKSSLESRFLYEQVNLMCVVLVRKKRYAAAANATWTNRCNGVRFVELLPRKSHSTHARFSFHRQFKSESSWRILCDAARTIPPEYSWALFVYDDIFAIPENIRRMVAHLDPSVGHYLGHAVTLWGVAHNAAPAGYVLSNGALNVLRAKFNSSDACLTGGKYWRQEDYHLGRHLSRAGVLPVDTRDFRGLTTFHSSVPERLLPADDGESRINNGRASIYPITECCSPFSVTFRVAEADRMYTYEYLLYNLFVFESGTRGNTPAKHPQPDDSVWMKFVRERGLTTTNISADLYFELWKAVVNDPVHFNKHIRNWRAATAAVRR